MKSSDIVLDKAITEIKEGGLHSVPGLRGGAVAGGIKASGDLDIALIDAGEERTAAAVFTQNQLAAAPVRLSQKRLAIKRRVRTIVINSGNANALTGVQGDKDAETMLECAEDVVGSPALVMSTGVIGVPLPIDRIVAGIKDASKRLSADGLSEVARAIMTTDTRPKTSAVSVLLPPEDGCKEQMITVGGVAKGSGMIHPNMATMLGIIATDAPLESGFSQQALSQAVNHSFNSISVDGDTSTNDTVVMLSGGSELNLIRAATERGQLMLHAIGRVAKRLAWQIVEDGEGANRMATIVVDGAKCDAEAKMIARAIACSSLFKTALAGGDPNWGRILAAAANAGVPLDVSRLCLNLGGVEVFAKGAPLLFDTKKVNEIFASKTVLIQLSIGTRDGHAEVITTDLTKEYVEINSEYTT